MLGACPRFSFADVIHTGSLAVGGDIFFPGLQTFMYLSLGQNKILSHFRERQFSAAIQSNLLDSLTLRVIF
jgi:hypothetical protein